MRYERLKTEYVCYLMNRAQIEAAGDFGYLKLCEKLQATEFVPILDMDENRCFECRNLRKDFAEGLDESVSDILDDLLSENGTMMELLTVLAEKMAYDLADSEFECGTGKWFKELLENCGLIEICNEVYARSGPDGTDDYVNDILETINTRSFGWDGEGSLFPLRWPKEDQRKIELIIQMNNYIEENYDIS